MTDHPTDPSVEALLRPATLRETYPEYDGQSVHTQTQPARDPDHVDAETVLPADVAKALEADLYAHQATALERLQAGDNVTVATSTASGKTWIYTLYFALLKRQNPDARALFLYPTKALSTDQEQTINDLLGRLGVDAKAETYDGDTPSDRRPRVREQADIVISNFAGINVYLNDHVKWRDVYRECELLVLDESHTYTGIHGMHVAWTVRRLRRIIDHYGADPQLVCSTATIGNPATHSETVTGASFTVVDKDGSPRGRRDIVFWQPPVEEAEPDEAVSETERGPAPRRAATEEAAGVAAHLGLNGVQTLTFARSRQETEVGVKQAIGAARAHPGDGYLDIEPYHAGLSKRKRRATENELKGGALDAVISTSALELGIDIGSVDATILAGYPGTRQSFWQQIGRAGRGTSDALSVFVPRGGAIDRYILDNPAYLLSDAVEDAVVDLTNNAVYARHVLCAAAERPLTDADSEWFGPRERLERAIAMWRDAGQLVGNLDRGAQYDGPPRPQSTISMYTTTDQQYEVRCANGEIDMEPLDKERVYRDYHPGALALYDGQQYEVTDVVEDRPQPVVRVRSVDTREYTQTMSDKHVHEVVSERSVDLGGGFALHAGTGTVEIQYHSYKRVDIETGRMVGAPEPTGVPPISLRTQLMWVELPRSILGTVMDTVPRASVLSAPEETSMGDREWTLGGGLHGAEHGMIKLAPLELRLDNSDMGGLSTVLHPEIDSPVWFIHDAVEGGVGFAHRIYDRFERIATRTRERVAACDCDRDNGCPACVMSSQCGNENEPLHRPATTAVLDAVLGRL
jgi:DEAD/DEAH box helicase domain-containing protein